MNLPLLQDRHSTSLLNRVRKDVSLLRADIGNLLSDTTHRALPNTAHEIADRAKHQIAAGGAYAVSRFRDLKSSPPPAASWVGGAAILGLIALGAYAIHCRNCACRQAAADERDESDFDVGGA
jgi:hypothetical protein